MRHCSVQVRGLLTKEELERYHALMEVGQFLESHNRYDLSYTVQKEIEILIQPAVERLKEKGRERDRATLEYVSRNRAEETQEPEACSPTIVPEDPKE